MGCSRRLWILAVVLPSCLVSVNRAVASPNHTPQESAIVACHEAVLDAARRLTSDIEGHLGRCVTHGIDCLTSTADPLACCARVAGRCDDDLQAIHESEGDFENLVAARSCTRVPRARVLASDGLGFGSLADRCACLTPPLAVDSLAALASCLRRLVEDDVVRRLASVSAPRAREALVCLALDAEFPVAFEERPASCDACPAPTPSASPAATISPVVTASPVATAAPTATLAATPTASMAVVSTPTAAPATVTPTVEMTAAPTPTVAVTAAPTPAATLTPLVVPTPSATPTRPPTASPSRTPTPVVTPVGVCGNGIVEGNEECDGAAIDNTSCAEDICTCDDFCDDAGGTLSCNPDCTLNFSNCTAGGCEF